MADYWKSNPKKYCKICKCWIQDNATSVNNHESGQRHVGNVQNKLNELQKNATASSKKKMHEKISLINDKAFIGMMKDIERDPLIAKRYGIDPSDEQLNSLKEKLKKVQEENKKDKKKSAAPSSSVTKPLTYEWKEVKTNDGRMYYWNKKTGVTQWSHPKVSIQPANDAKCASREEKRLDQFSFNRLVELSESGSFEASTAVCQAFGASAESDQHPCQPPDVEKTVVSKRPVIKNESVSDEKRPRVNLLGEWELVVPQEPVKNITIDTEPAEESTEIKPECEIKRRITSLANNTWIDDEVKLEEISEKAELLSHLSEVNEANIFSEYNIKFEEKRSAVSSAAKKVIRKIEFTMKPDARDKTEPTSLPSTIIEFKRKANTLRSLRQRNNID